MEKIGRYLIKGEIGRGGMAAVYLAYDPAFERDVAVKVLPSQFLHDPTFRLRFDREARTIAALEHPAIVPVYDYGEENGQPFLVMRLMAGGSLADRMKHGPIPLAEAAQIFSRLAPALDMAHTAGVIHRDLKPANILFDQDGYAYISDFGIAKLTNDATTALTGSALIGTPAYMSPEQARGDAIIDGRSDIYAMGAILFQMLTGKLPYEADTPIQQAIKHVIEPVPPILQINPNLPLGCDQVIRQAMAKTKEGRFATAKELAENLMVTSTHAEEQTLIAHPKEQPPTTIHRQASRLPASRIHPNLLIRGAWIGGILAIVLVIGLMIIPGSIGLKDQASKKGPNGSNSSGHDVGVLTSTVAAKISPETPHILYTLTPIPIPSKTLSLINTPLLTEHPTFVNTPVGVTPYLTLDKNYHCRGGPEASYPILRDLRGGSTIEIHGRDQAGDWFLVKIDDPSTRKKLCWITVGDYPGNRMNLPVCSWTGDGYTEDQICQ